jgi:apolipoprotein N-acyltransferase
MTRIRYRLGVASRALAALFGGYALSALFALAMARWLPLPRDAAVIGGMTWSFVVYTCVVIWVFAARTAVQAWAGVGVPILLLGGALLLARLSMAG